MPTSISVNIRIVEQMFGIFMDVLSAFSFPLVLMGKMFNVIKYPKTTANRRQNVCAHLYSYPLQYLRPKQSPNLEFYDQ